MPHKTDVSKQKKKVSQCDTCMCRSRNKSNNTHFITAFPAELYQDQQSLRDRIRKFN